MSVGYPLDKAVIDSRAGQLAVMARDLFRQIADFKLKLDGITDAELGAAPYSYTSDEIANLRSGIGDLAQLGLICNAQATQAQANDFLFFARRLMGAS